MHGLCVFMCIHMGQQCLMMFSWVHKVRHFSISFLGWSQDRRVKSETAGLFQLKPREHSNQQCSICKGVWIAVDVCVWVCFGQAYHALLLPFCMCKMCISKSVWLLFLNFDDHEAAEGLANMSSKLKSF